MYHDWCNRQASNSGSIGRHDPDDRARLFGPHFREYLDFRQYLLLCQNVITRRSPTRFQHQNFRCLASHSCHKLQVLRSKAKIALPRSAEVGQGGNESRITVCLGFPAIAGIPHASKIKGTLMIGLLGNSRRHQYLSNLLLTRLCILTFI